MDHLLHDGTSSGTDNHYNIMHHVLVDTGVSQALRHGSHDITEVIHAEFRNLAFDSDSNCGLGGSRKLALDTRASDNKPAHVNILKRRPPTESVDDRQRAWRQQFVQRSCGEITLQFSWAGSFEPFVAHGPQVFVVRIDNRYGVVNVPDTVDGEASLTNPMRGPCCLTTSIWSHVDALLANWPRPDRWCYVASTHERSML